MMELSNGFVCFALGIAVSAGAKDVTAWEPIAIGILLILTLVTSFIAKTEDARPPHRKVE